MLVAGTVFALISLATSLVILVHAFRRSVGTGVMVLCIPGFIAFYAFSQFEHRRKGLILSAWIASVVLAAVFNAFGARELIQAANARPPPVM